MRDSSSSSSPSSRLSLSRGQFAAIAELRWRLLVNSWGRRGGKSETAAKVLLWPFYALIGLGPVIGAGAGAYFAIGQPDPQLLVLLLWGVFVVWQLIGINTAAATPELDLSALILYPLSFRDYFLVRILFGLFDLPTVFGGACLLSMTVGIGIAAPRLLPWAGLALLVYFAVNVLLTRMVYAWLERWLAKRKTRELVTGILVVLSLSFQLIAPSMRKIRNAPGPMVRVYHWLAPVGRALPPGLTASSIALVRQGRAAAGALALGAAAVYGIGFLAVFGLRMSAEYHGENLSETAVSGRAQVSASHPSRASDARSGWGTRIHVLPAAVAASLEKEVHQMLRTGPLLYNFLVPPFMVLIFANRATGGMGTHSAFIFPVGAAYALLVVANLLYNSFGAEGTGIQFYFFAPVRIRDVAIAKNLAMAAMLALQVLLVWVVVELVQRPPSAAVVMGTVAWLVFALLLNMVVGNLRSLYSPRKYEAGKVKKQGASRMNVLISFGVLAVAYGAGWLVYAVAERAGNLWLATPVMLALAAVAFIGYVRGLGWLDEIAQRQRELLAEVLCRA